MSLYSEIGFQEFQKLPEIEDMEDINSNRFKKGDVFLMGKNVISQKYNRNPGDIVTVYQITEMESSSCSYSPKYLKIKKETENA